MNDVTWICITAIWTAINMAAAPATKPVDVAGQSHQIASVSHEHLLRPRDASSKDGTPIVLYPQQNWRCLTWKFEPAGDDVRLINYFTKKTLHPDGHDEGAAVTQHPAGNEVTDAERWRFVPVGENLYRIEHLSSGKVLSVTADGGVAIEKWSEVDSQKWKLLDKPDHFTG